jgi:hypothetical protein
MIVEPARSRRTVSLEFSISQSSVVELSRIFYLSRKYIVVYFHSQFLTYQCNFLYSQRIPISFLLILYNDITNIHSDPVAATVHEAGCNSNYNPDQVRICGDCNKVGNLLYL